MAKSSQQPMWLEQGVQGEGCTSAKGLGMYSKSVGEGSDPCGYV